MYAYNYTLNASAEINPMDAMMSTLLPHECLEDVAAEVEAGECHAVEALILETVGAPGMKTEITELSVDSLEDDKLVLSLGYSRTGTKVARTNHYTTKVVLVSGV